MVRPVAKLQENPSRPKPKREDEGKENQRWKRMKRKKDNLLVDAETMPMPLLMLILPPWVQNAVVETVSPCLTVNASPGSEPSRLRDAFYFQDAPADFR